MLSKSSHGAQLLLEKKDQHSFVLKGGNSFQFLSHSFFFFKLFVLFPLEQPQNFKMLNEKEPLISSHHRIKT